MPAHLETPVMNTGEAWSEFGGHVPVKVIQKMRHRQRARAGCRYVLLRPPGVHPQLPVDLGSFEAPVMVTALVSSTQWSGVVDESFCVLVSSILALMNNDTRYPKPLRRLASRRHAT